MLSPITSAPVQVNGAGSRNGETMQETLEPIDLTQTLKAASWRKSKLAAPHEYVLKHDRPQLFNMMKAMIARDGYRQAFQGRTYLYIDLDGYKYWTVDVVLNRAKLNEVHEDGQGKKGN